LYPQAQKGKALPGKEKYGHLEKPPQDLPWKTVPITRGKVSFWGKRLIREGSSTHTSKKKKELAWN